ncbi:profilin [Xylaria flabelliformis]|nr:profilin [Xylaria flabelliformis]KAI0857867.1 Profilin/allergen [Xylaria cubensis]
MSWQQYIDTSLVGSGHIDQAAIVSAAGDSVWAQSSGFNPSSGELKTLVAVLNAAADEKSDQSQVAKAQSEGLHVANDRYVVARIDGRSIYARKGRTGVCIAKTKQAFIIAHHGEAQTAGNATSTTEALADYLIKVGY